MKHSLRLRLLAGMLVWMLLTIAAAGWGLRALLQGHVEQQLAVQLVMDLDHLSGSIDWAPDGRLDVENQPDARLAQPLSGLYWQIDRLAANGQPAAAGVARSRSLWDQTLQAPPEAPGEGDRAYDVAGPGGRELAALGRVVTPAEDGAAPLRLLVAADRAALAEPIERFNHMLAIALGALAAGLTVAAVVQVLVGLRPLARLRRELAAQDAGDSRRIEGSFPARSSRWSTISTRCWR